MSLWLRLASHLHMSLQAVQAQTTSREFVRWNRYLDAQQLIHQKMDYYLAQIAAEVHRPHSKHPENVSLDKFLLKFKRDEKDEEMTEEESKTKAEKFKSFFTGYLGAMKKKLKGE